VVVVEQPVEEELLPAVEGEVLLAAPKATVMQMPVPHQATQDQVAAEQQVVVQPRAVAAVAA
jgi:hypothetical protein